MDLTTLTKLIDAGFTKDDILNLTSNEPKTEVKTETNETTKPQPMVIGELTRVENKNEEVKTEPKTEVQTIVNQVPVMSDAQVEKLAQMLNMGNATIDVPKMRDSDEALKEHFSALIKGEI